MNWISATALAAIVVGCAAPMRMTLAPERKPSADTIRGVSTVASIGASSDTAITTAAPMRPGDTTWIIERGTFEGRPVVLHFDAAAGSRRRTEHFWRLPPGGSGASAAAANGVVGWSASKYPLPLAFRHTPRNGISISDSLAFWDAVADMSADLGMSLFQPATLKDGEDPQDVIVVDFRPMGNIDGFTRVSWSQSGDLFDVRITLRDRQALRDPHVVTHELMHALGFGHTNSWPSVVSGAGGPRTPRLTPEDVAYAEVAMRLRASRERSDLRSAIALAVSRDAIRFDAAASYLLSGADSELSAGDGGAIKYCGGFAVLSAVIVPFCRAQLR